MTAEYRSAAITQHLTLWLIQLGASPDLILAGLRIVKDELAHADLSHRTFVAAGGESTGPIVRETLQLRRDEREPLERSVTRACVEVFCLGETVAVPLFKVLREECTVPPARRALDRILVDEVRHRDFGWMLLQFLIESPAEKLARELVVAELPGMFERLRRSYAPASASARSTIPAEDRAWGLMPMARYGQILARAVERDYAPRFGKLGFDARSAWQGP